MKDVQRAPAEVPIAIDRVGIKGFRLPLRLKVRDPGRGPEDPASGRTAGRLHTVADADVSVDLPALFKGTHMSRFVEALESWRGELDYHGLRELLDDVRRRLEAQNAHLSLRFPYFLKKAAPATGAESLMDYDCSVVGELLGGAYRLTLGVDAPVMTVCPCSLAISATGAHGQRAVVRMRCRTAGMVWIEELIEAAEAAGSSPVYALLKREDEKYVTEAAFADPVFVEDVARRVAERLGAHRGVEWFRVEVESEESIHNHGAFAVIEGGGAKGRP